MPVIFITSPETAIQDLTRRKEELEALCAEAYAALLIYRSGGIPDWVTDDLLDRLDNAACGLPLEDED